MIKDRDSRALKDATALKGQSGARRIYNALGYSIAGFSSAFADEAAFRQLCLLNVLLFPIALWVNVSPGERAILLLTPLFCLVVELLNSAIENTVDRISMDIHPLSKKAKDMGSAAQLLAMTMIAVAWGSILLG